MLRRNWLLGLFILIAGLPLAPQAQKKPASSLLWKISGNGLKQPSYIFGTFHLMCKSDFTITPALEAKLKSCKQFYGELDMDDPGMQLSLMSKMRLSNNSLSEFMGESTYKAVSDSFRNITGMPLMMFNQFSPFVPMSMLAMSSITCKDKVQPEMAFVMMAKESKLTIAGLETIDDQINAINAEPLDSQVKAFKESVLKYDSVKQMMDKMSAVYKQRNIEKLYRFIMDNGGSSNFETAMLVNRNNKWIPVMKKAMKAMPSFFAVGAGHLGGKQGVIALLKKEGYTLTPLLY